MRLLLPFSFAALMLGACASVPAETSRPNLAELASVEGATPGLVAVAQTDQELGVQEAQLRVIREAEARVDLARARLDYATVRNRGADDGDVREFLEARRALRDARNVYGPTETGRQEFRYWPVIHDPYWPRRRSGGYWTGDPVGTFGLRESEIPKTGGGRKLSGLAGNN